MNDKKLTKLEKYWIMYDVGNSAFILLVSTIIPIYFNHLSSMANISEVNYLAYWGYAASLTTAIVAIIGPVLGSIVDTKGYKKPFFSISMMVGVLALAALSFPTSWVIFLAFVLFYESIGMSFEMAIMIAFFINAIWWFALTIPLLRKYQQVYYVEKPKHPIRQSFQRLFHTLKEITKDRKVFLFLVAFFFYIDGVYTIIDMATAYGSALGLDTQGLLVALLVTQIVAFPFALIFSKLSKIYPAKLLIKICIVAYTCIALFAIQLDKQWEFWLLAICVGMFQGAIQALSRSYFAKIIPPQKSGEYFGLFDICGKGASFMGTALVSITAQLTGYMNIGVGMISIMFVIGFYFFNKATKEM